MNETVERVTDVLSAMIAGGVHGRTTIDEFDLLRLFGCGGLTLGRPPIFGEDSPVIITGPQEIQ